MGKGLRLIVSFWGSIFICVLFVCFSSGIWSDPYRGKSAEAEKSLKNVNVLKKLLFPEKEQKDADMLEVNVSSTDIWGAEYITEIDFGNQEYATQADIIHVGQLQHLKSLSIRIEDDAIDLTPLGNLAELEELSIYICPWNNLDLSFMKKLGQLEELNISAGEDTDLSPLSSLTGLKRLSVYSYYEVYNLSFLKELNQLEELYLHKICAMEDLSFLQDMVYLKKLWLFHVDDVDLEYLSKLENLEGIDIIGENIRNPEGLANMEHLRSLNLNNIYPGEEIFDLSSLTQLPELERISLTDIRVEDVSPLAEADNLSYICFVSSGVEDILPLKDLELEYLWIFGNESEKVRQQAEKYFSDIHNLVITEEMPYW